MNFTLRKKKGGRIWEANLFLNQSQEQIKQKQIIIKNNVNNKNNNNNEMGRRERNNC